MDRLERFYKIDRLLKERKLVSFAVFKHELGMSPASVKRDLAYMRDRYNAPIEYDREANAYRFGKPRTGPRYELPGLWFNASEVLALLTTLRMLGDLQPGMLDGQIEPLRERLRAILGSGDHSWEEVEKRIRIFQPERRAGDPQHFGVIAAAELDEHLGSGYGIFAGRKVEWATLRFNPAAARWVSAQSWHPKQRTRVDKDGSYYLELPYSEAPELVMEILKYGPDVEVLG